MTDKNALAAWINAAKTLPALRNALSGMDMIYMGHRAMMNPFSTPQIQKQKNVPNPPLNSMPIVIERQEEKSIDQIPSPSENQSIAPKRTYERYEVTANQVASDLGVSERAVQYWDKGRNPPKGYVGRKDRAAYLIWREGYLMNRELRRETKEKRRPIPIDFSAIDEVYKEPDGTTHKAGRRCNDGSSD